MNGMIQFLNALEGQLVEMTYRKANGHINTYTGKLADFYESQAGDFCLAMDNILERNLERRHFNFDKGECISVKLVTL